MVWHKEGSTQISGRLRRNSWCATWSRCGFVRACHCCTFAQTQCVRLFCAGCAAAGALTTVSLFLKRKAADVSRGSDRGEWNVGAIFELNTHAQTKPPGSSVNSCCRFLHLLHHTCCDSSWKWNPCRQTWQGPNTAEASILHSSPSACEVGCGARRTARPLSTCLSDLLAIPTDLILNWLAHYTEKETSCSAVSLSLFIHTANRVIFPFFKDIWLIP